MNSGKRIALDVVDTWEGTPGNAEHERIKAEVGDLYIAFLNNIDPLLRRAIKAVVRTRSVDAAARYVNGTVQFVFLDGGHSREAVAADIAAWYPKVRPGGYIGGHDFSYNWMGVVESVLRFTNGRNFEVIGNSWLYRKEK